MSSALGSVLLGKFGKLTADHTVVVNWATNTRLSSPAIPFVWPGGAANQPPPMLSSIEKLLPASNSLWLNQAIVLTKPPALSALVVAPMVTYESHSASGATTIMAGLMLLRQQHRMGFGRSLWLRDFQGEFHHPTPHSRRLQKREFRCKRGTCASPQAHPPSGFGRVNHHVVTVHAGRVGFVAVEVGVIARAVVTRTVFHECSAS